MDARQDHLAKITARLLVGICFVAVVFTVVMTCAYYGKMVLSTPLMVFLVGSGGGFVSIHRRLLTMDDAKIEFYATSWTILFTSPFVGGVLAVVLYFLFLSKIISSTIFPSFEADCAPVSHTLLDMYHSSGLNFSEWAKLAFWSFVAGYSEDFVLAVIDSVKASAIDKVRGAKTPPQPAQQDNQ